MRYLVGFSFVLALGLMGCSETAGTGGTGGSAGDGGAGGMGGGSVGGTGGAAGNPIEPCEPTTERCMSATIDPHVVCCEQVVPDQPNACDGTESLENPATCAPTGNTVTHRLTLMEIEDDCNVGYDLDDCDGTRCVPNTSLAPGDGVSGVDNAVAGLATLFEVTGADFRAVNQELADSLCGATDDLSAGTCRRGENDGNACTRQDGCPGAGAQCDVFDGDCLLAIVPTEIRFVIDANADAGCATVVAQASGEANAHILNLSDDGCVSGTLGTIPITLASIEGSIENAVVRMTVSSAGFSHGLLGAALDANITRAVMDLLGDDFPVVFDINGSTSPTQGTPAVCNAMSVSLSIGGVAE